MGKRSLRDGDEQNAFTGWRKFYCYLQRAGVRKAIKRQANKRERSSVAAREIEERLHDD